MIHKTTLNQTKVKTRKIWASYNEDADKIVKQAKQKKEGENLNFLIDLSTMAMAAEDKKTTKEAKTNIQNA